MTEVVTDVEWLIEQLQVSGCRWSRMQLPPNSPSSEGYSIEADKRSGFMVWYAADGSLNRASRGTEGAVRARLQLSDVIAVRQAAADPAEALQLLCDGHPLEWVLAYLEGLQCSQSD